MAKAKKDDSKISKNRADPYPVEVINRGMLIESARRNITTIIWYKRLITGTFALLIASAAFTLIAALCAWRQPAPKVYASAIDGPLYEINFSRTGSGNELSELMSLLNAEQDSKNKLSSGKRISMQKMLEQQAAQAAAAAQAGPAVEPSATAQSPSPAQPQFTPQFAPSR